VPKEVHEEEPDRLQFRPVNLTSIFLSTVDDPVVSSMAETLLAVVEELP
jgi:hypothetical protein